MNQLRLTQKPFTKSFGFTLIEVLIALAIIAIALTAIIKATTDDVRTATYLENKTYAHWVGMQAIYNIQSNSATIDSLPKKLERTTALFNKNWYWTAIIDRTPEPHINRITVLITDKQHSPAIDSLVGYTRATAHAKKQTT